MVISQVFYPNGSHTPRGKIRGGFGFNSAPLNLESVTTVTLEYEVLMEVLTVIYDVY